MKVEIKDAPKSQKEISVEVPYEDYEKALNVQTKEIAKNAKVAGFRPGKAPIDIVKKQNLHKIKAAALEKIISDAIKDTLVSNNINPLNQPSVSNVVLDEDKPLTFKVHVDVFPFFEIAKVDGHKFDRTVIKITDADIETTLGRLCDQYSEFTTLKRKRKVKTGDQVIMDYCGKVAGVAFDGGTAEKQALEIGSGQFIPGFEDGVIGMSVDETKDILVKFPEVYHSAELAGKDSIFTVTIHEIKEKIKPELDAEFAKKVSPRFDSFDKLREAIAKDLQNEADHFVKLEGLTLMLDTLIKENPFEVPESIVYEQAQRMAKQNLQQYYNMGINPEAYGFNMNTMVTQFMTDAEKQIKRALVINKIADMYKLEVTDDDVKKEFLKMSDITGRSVEDIEKDVMGNNQYVASLKNDLASDKVYDYLSENNKINETVMSKEEYEKHKAEHDAKAATEQAEAIQKQTKHEKKGKGAKAEEEA